MQKSHLRGEQSTKNTASEKNKKDVEVAALTARVSVLEAQLGGKRVAAVSAAVIAVADSKNLYLLWRDKTA